MRIPLFFVQIVLLVLWYALPTFAAIPWWIIWLPTLVPLACFGVIIGIPAIGMVLLGILLGLIGIIEAIANWNRARINRRRSKLSR